MKKAFFVFTAVCGLMLSAASFAQSADKLKPGDNLPGADISMHSTTGKNITLKSAVDENGLLVMFSCNTCPFVVRNQAVALKTIAYAKEHHMGVVVINSNEAQRSDADSYEAMKRYAKEQGYNAEYVVDEGSKVADMFGANHTPEIFIFNKKGVLEYKGAMNDNPSNPSDAKKAYANEAIDAVVAGKKMTPNSTKSVGCSIKRKV